MMNHIAYFIRRHIATYVHGVPMGFVHVPAGNKVGEYASQKVCFVRVAF
jgi:pyrrolidone-carboxylate peptidase